jgi:eukaryotic-like serine/threonine-protein kinase
MSGTPAYLAPEQLRGEALTQAADWYAVGAALAELLESVCTPKDETTRARLEMLRSLAQGLRTDAPQDRFGAREILDSLGATPTERPSYWSADDLTFAGREPELERLTGALARARQGGVVCTVSGDAGIGKTALIEHFLALPELVGALTLRGRCYEAECLPYRGVDGLIDDLALYLLSLADAVRSALVGTDTDALLQVFPRLRRAGLPTSSPGTLATTPRLVRRRAFEQMLRLLGEIARVRPLVIFIDDLQWADADGALLLSHLVSRSAPALLLLASFRSDAEGPGLDALASAASESLAIALGPLDADACNRVASEARGNVDRAASDVLLRESGGSPLLLQALLHTESAPGDQARTYTQLMTQVIDTLDRPTRELLALVVLAGRPLSLELLTTAAEQVEQPHLCLAVLRARRLVRTILRDDVTQLLPHHDRVRELVTQQLPDAERTDCHARLARAAVALSLDDPEFLANHYYCADDRAAAGHHAECAGDRARATMALSRASELYLRALACAAPSRPSRLVEKLADVAAAAGDLTRAGPLYVEAAAARPLDGWELRLRAAEVFLQRGAEQVGMGLLRPAMREGRIPVPTSMTRAFWLGGLSLARSHWASRPARSSTFRTDAPNDPRTELAFRAGHLICLHDPKGAALILWSAARALEHGSSAQRGRALASLAFVYALLGLRSVAEQDELVRRSLVLTAQDPLALTAALASKAMIAFGRCQCDQALRTLETIRAMTIEQRLDAQWLLGQIHSIAASVCVLAGDFRRLAEFGTDAEREALELGNRTVLAQVQSALAWAALAAGDAESMRRYTQGTLAEWRAPRLSPIYGIAVWGECNRLLYEGDTRAAYALMQAEAPRFVRSGLSHTRTWSTSLSQLWGSVELANAREPNDSHVRAAEKHAARLERQALPVAQAWAALLRAGLARRAGRTALARETYRRAKHGFVALGMLGYAATAARWEAQLGQARDEQALAWFTRQSVAAPSSWVRMYAP